MLTKNCLVIFLLFFSTVRSATLFESSYEYVLKLGKNVAPSVMSIFDCFSEDDAWNSAKEKAGKILDSWNEEVDKQRRNWQDAADAEVRSSGRTLNEMPSQLGKEVEQSLGSFAELIQHGVARALERNHHESKVGIDMKTVSVSSNDKKRLKKKKQGPAKIHLHNPAMMLAHKQEEEGRGFPGKVQSWIIGARDLDDDNASLNTASTNPDDSTSVVDGSKFEIEDTGSEDSENNTEDSETDNDTKNELIDSNADVYNFRKSRGLISDMWGIGEKALDAVAEHVIENENADNGIQDKSSLEEQRGKKKKKKKAILKLLILGAVLKAKIGTLLQILSFKLQVKFFIIALIGLAINLARFWIDLKNKHHHQPQKVIYYEHAQHQHHYDEHEEEPGWGPWSRSIDPEEELDAELNNRPYRAQERVSLSTIRPLLTLT